MGYGLDHEERYRNLPLIVAVDDQTALTDDPDLLAPLLAARNAEKVEKTGERTPS